MVDIHKHGGTHSVNGYKQVQQSECELQGEKVNK